MTPESVVSRKEVNQRNCWEQFAEVSGATAGELASLQAELVGLPELPEDPIEACYSIRSYLIEKGFHYNDKVFRLGDLASTRSGNCLGLALLFGAILESRGYNPTFEIVLTPKDAVYERELRMLEDYTSGSYFPYDQAPAVPKLQAAHPQLRFAPLEHPAIIVFDGRRFETTSLDDETDPEVKYEAELLRSVNYTQVSFCYLESSTVF